LHNDFEVFEHGSVKIEPLVLISGTDPNSQPRARAVQLLLIMEADLRESPGAPSNLNVLLASGIAPAVDGAGAAAAAALLLWM
jgi:hypothetical protein